MALIPGTRLGVYEVTAQIGAGGMGEVYRARDTKLNRDVAIKVLPESFAHDAERLARFTREAQTLASLNHPHIAAIYGIEDCPEPHPSVAGSQHIRALVMELVEGEDLSQQIARRAIPLNEALPIARQIAEALEAAHEKGVIHRDLKPANIKVRADGTVKVLDFGLAKILEPGGAGRTGTAGTEHLTQSPTITSPAMMTGAGMLLGTAAYMSPEQARGTVVDTRADLWAFGVVLWEMLTGARLFEGATISDTLAEVLKTEPDWHALAPTTPAAIRRLLRRCLEKERKRRLDSAAAARLEIDDALGSPWSQDTSAAPVHMSTAPAVSLLRFQEQSWGRPSEFPAISISPDGRHLALGAEGPDGIQRLWVRTLSEPSPRAVPGTELSFVVPPFWSPDSSFLAWASGGPVKKISLSGGTPQTIGEITPNCVGGSWNRDDIILLGNPNGGVIRCLASGGGTTLATRTAEPSEMHIFPSFLPDGRRFIYLRVYRQAPERAGLCVGDLASQPSDGDRFLMATGFNASYVAAADGGLGVLLFLRDRSLYAQRLDDKAVELRGNAVKLADRVGSVLDYACYSASEKLLAYRVHDPPSQLTWFDREGRPLAPVGAPEAVAGLAVSPDGSFALVARHIPHNVVAQDLWLFDLRRDTNPRRMTFAPALAGFPVWVTSERFLFRLGGGSDGSVYEQTISGQRRLLFSRNGEFPMPTSAAAGGRAVVFTTVADPAMGADIWIWTDKGAPLITREGDQGHAQLSPDGRWLAYVSNETGRNEVFVASFRFDESTGDASVGDSMPVSDGGGFAPRWRGDGKELLYLQIDGSVMAIEADAARTFSSGPARRLFTAPGVLPEWGITHDGSRLLFAVPTAPPPSLSIVYDWQSALPK